MKLVKQEKALYARVRELIIAARRSVARGVDLVQVHTNFEIGRHIVEQEQRGKGRADYGKEIVRNLAGKLTFEFGRGFSKSNLEYMRRFYLSYKERLSIAQFKTGQFAPDWNKTPSIAQFQTGQLMTSALTPQIFSLSWTHYVFLLGIQNKDERDFYDKEDEQKTARCSRSYIERFFVESDAVVAKKLALQQGRF